MTDLLTASESTALAEHEAVIERGIKTFYEVGMALADIRDRRLYRAEHGTFEDYCQQRWQMSRRRAYQMIEAADAVGTMVHTELPPPSNERQARELSRVPEPERADVWRETVERTDGKPTAAAVRETHEQRQQRPAPGEPPSDADLFAGEDWVQPEGSGFEQAATPPPNPLDAFTEDERALHKRLTAGETVVVSLRIHQNLIAWADDRGLYERIDRRTPWGNPFELPADGDRDTVIANYEQHYLPYKPSLLARLHELKGKALGCWCVPEPCHGDILKNGADEL